MALSLLEASKLMPTGTPRALIQLYAETYHPLQVMPIQPRANGVMRWTVEDTLDSNVGARAIGSDYIPGQGTVKPYASVTKAYGGKIQVDNKIQTEEGEAVSFYKGQQVRALARKTAIDLFEGTGGTSWRGVRDYVQNDPSYTGQNISANPGAAAIVPTMTLMDSLLFKANIVPGNTFIYSNLNPFQVMATLSRSNGVGQQNIFWQKDDFGVLVPFYNGIPWKLMRDGTGADMLSTTETETANTAGSACSIYVVTYGDEMFTGFQSSTPLVETAMDATNFKTSRLDWFAGVAPLIPRSVARLCNVKNALS